MRTIRCIRLLILLLPAIWVAGCGESDDSEDLIVSQKTAEATQSAKKTAATGSGKTADEKTAQAESKAAAKTNESESSGTTDGYGAITGQFVLAGDDVPQPEVIVEKGDESAKDSAVCAANAILSKKLVVDPDSKGIKNVYIYLRRAPKIHPDLESSSDQTVVFDQKGCEFLTHAMFVRTDQTVVIKSDDPITHNTHTYPLLGQPANFLIPPKDRDGQELSSLRAERQPFEVKCDVHPWMLAWWLVLDHPYAAVSDAQGKFTIEKLPAGEHEFYIVHEGQTLDRGFQVNVAAGQTTTLAPIEYSADTLLQ